MRVFYAKKIFNWRRELNYPINFSEFLQIFAFLQRVTARIWYVQNIPATIPAIICKNVHEHFHLDVDLRTIETRNNTAAAMQIHCVPSLRIRIKISFCIHVSFLQRGNSLVRTQQRRLKTCEYEITIFMSLRFTISFIFLGFLFHY